MNTRNLDDQVESTDNRSIDRSKLQVNSRMQPQQLLWLHTKNSMQNS
ncbi:hypothetical protein [Microcoleus sp. D3_18a_C4]